jgi:hypothetical protein
MLATHLRAMMNEICGMKEKVYTFDQSSTIMRRDRQETVAEICEKQ